MKRRNSIWIFGAALCLAACSQNDAKDTGKGSAKVEGSNPTPAPAADPKWIDIKEPRFLAQDGWKEEKPTSSMRVTQFRLPHADKDTDDAELGVFHFPGGGTVEDNFARWCSQFDQVDGKSASERAVRTTHNVGPYKVSEISVSGHYVAAAMPGGGEAMDKPGWTLLGAVVEGPGGPYFLKLAGPSATIEKWHASWNAFVTAMVP